MNLAAADVINQHRIPISNAYDINSKVHKYVDVAFNIYEEKTHRSNERIESRKNRPFAFYGIK